LQAIRDERPSAVILVDYPGFNLRFAELAKRQGLRVIYFISPQIWAWGRRRIKKIRRTVDLMLTIFKFEEEIYRRENVNAHFVGHPILDEIRTPSQPEITRFRERYFSKSFEVIHAEAKIVALLPGSRLQEINRILPSMLESVKVLRRELVPNNVGLEIVVGCAPGIDESVYQSIVTQTGVEVHLSHDVELLMSSSDAGIVTSGTATLEAALHDLPIVVVYKTSILTYLIGRLLIRLKTICLINIVAQKKIVDELVQCEFTPHRAAAILMGLLMNSKVAWEVKRNYADLRTILGGPGASDRAAELILSGRFQ
jgi:lipid-A-disaccharide synthase